MQADIEGRSENKFSGRNHRYFSRDIRPGKTCWNYGYAAECAAHSDKHFSAS